MRSVRQSGLKAALAQSRHAADIQKRQGYYVRKALLRFGSGAQWRLDATYRRMHLESEFKSSYQAPTPMRVEGALALQGDRTSADAEAHQDSWSQGRPSHQASQAGTNNQQMKRLSLQLSASLHREAKLAALEDEETLNSMVIGLLRQYLAQRRKALQESRHRGF